MNITPELFSQIASFQSNQANIIQNQANIIQNQATVVQHTNSKRTYKCIFWLINIYLLDVNLNPNTTIQYAPQISARPPAPQPQQTHQPHSNRVVQLDGAHDTSDEDDDEDEYRDNDDDHEDNDDEVNDDENDGQGEDEVLHRYYLLIYL